MADSAVDWPWNVLGLSAPTTEAREVRRAYAVRLKALAPEDVAGFQALRQAYEVALSWCGEGKQRRSVVADALRGGVEGTTAPAPPDTGSHGAGQTNDPALPEAEPREPVRPVASSAKAPGGPADWQSGGQRRAGATGAPDAAGRPVPAAPSVWDHAARAGLYDKVQSLLAVGSYDSDSWKPLLGSALLDDRKFARDIEGLIVRQMQSGLSPPPDAFLHAADARFGWRADGVGFQRRYPFAQRAQMFAMMAQARNPRASPAKNDNSARVGVAGVFFVVSLLVLARLLQELIDSAVPMQVVFSLIAAVLSVGAGLLFWAIGLRKLLWWAAGIVPPLQDRRFAIRRWFSGQVWRMSRWSAFLAGTTLAVWIFNMAFVFEFEHQPQPYVSMTAVEAAMKLENSQLGIFLTLFEGTEAFPPDGQPRLRFPSASLQMPDAPMQQPMMVFCPVPVTAAQTRACHLSMIVPKTLVRLIEVVPGHPLTGLHYDILRSPVVVLSVLDTEEGPTLNAVLLRAFQDVAFDSQIKSAFGDSLSLFPVSFPLQAPDDDTTDPAGQDPAADPLDPDRPLVFAADWARGPIVPNSWACRFPGPRPSETDDYFARMETCNVAPEHVLRRLQANCAAADVGTSCATALVDQAQAGEAGGTIDAPLTVQVDEEGVRLMRDLLRRAATPGAHPPLPPLPEVLAIRDAVLADYALILDRPEAADRRRDVDAMTRALAHQPQLRSVYKASAAKREAVWSALLSNLTRLGFDLPELMVVPGTD